MFAFLGLSTLVPLLSGIPFIGPILAGAVSFLFGLSPRAKKVLLVIAAIAVYTFVIDRMATNRTKRVYEIEKILADKAALQRDFNATKSANKENVEKLDQLNKQLAEQKELLDAFGKNPAGCQCVVTPERDRQLRQLERRP